MPQLRPHQQDAYTNVTDAIVAGNGSASGRIVIPTGGGKTFIEAAIIDYQRSNNATTRIHLVLAPRILLANQLIDEYAKFSGADAYGVVAFHSGNYEPDYEQIKWKVPSTTQVAEIETAYKAALARGQDLVVFSTYHSSVKLKGIKFDTLIADESQYCVNENFNDAIKTIDARVRLFFTATERYTASDKGRGLNNETVYGKRLFYISPATLIQLGLIVPPRLHIMYAETRNKDDSVVSEILELAKAQNDLTHPKLGFSKILFAMNGTDDVKSIEDNIVKVRKELPAHDVFTITSKTGAKINGVKIKREDFLTELKTRENCLIFHYDILSEGIDVDGITGVALMRNMGLSKLLQTIGRAVRVYKPNPELKNEAWISVSVLNGDEDDKARVKRFVEAIRDGGHDISYERVVETGDNRHTADEEGVDDAYNKAKVNFSTLFIEEIFHEIEEADFWKDIKAAGDHKEQIDKLFEMFDEE